MTDQKQLLDRYVAAFGRLDDLIASETLDPIAWLLSVGDPDQHGFKNWQPARIGSPASCLQDIYSRLTVAFPPLYESLVLSFRWAEVDLQSYRLLVNPPGPDLSGLLEEMSRDSGLWESLLPSGYVQFGRGPDIDYDPVCFDTRSRSRSGDCKIVKIDHEEILCNYRVKVVAELAPSFEQLVLQTIQQGELVG